MKNNLDIFSSQSSSFSNFIFNFTRINNKNEIYETIFINPYNFLRSIS